MNSLLPALIERPDRLAAILPDGEITWTELAQLCAGHRKRLAAEGVQPGQRVAVWAHPTVGTIGAIVGNLVAGVVTVPLNPRLGERELEHIMNDAEPHLVLDRPEAELGGVEDIYVEIDDRDALVIYTSGTTGPPKGAVLSVRNLAACLDGLADAWLWRPVDTVVHALPLFHVHGLVLGLFGSLRIGGAMHALERFEIPAITSALRSGATMLFAVPTMYHRMAEALDEHPDLAGVLRSARMLISGSAPLAARDGRILQERAGVTIHQRYGLTETLINCAARYGEPVIDGTVGRPLPGVELRITDDQGQELRPGEIGEIAVRGANVFSGYLNRPGATAEVMRDGWFFTGDVGERDASGVVKVHGRRSTDLIKSGGYKIGAGEIEACLLEHPDVSEVAVIGAPDDDLGERVVAFVVPADDQAVDGEALGEWVASQLSSYKRPRQFESIDQLPRNAMGKVRKRALKDSLT